MSFPPCSSLCFTHDFTWKAILRQRGIFSRSPVGTRYAQSLAIDTGGTEYAQRWRIILRRQDSFVPQVEYANKKRFHNEGVAGFKDFLSYDVLASEEVHSNVEMQASAQPSSSADYLKSKGLERTHNKTGFMFLTLHEPSLKPWIDSLRGSSKPIADLGACYGVHTEYALKHGRDVIALDADPVHIEKLCERVKAMDGEGSGRLVDARVERLPCGSAFEECSLAGVLLSEVLHFLPLHAPQQVFLDVYKWLEPGGILVATVSSAKTRISKFGVHTYVLKDGRSIAEAEKIVKYPPENIVDLAPGYMTLPPGSKVREKFVDHLYLMTREEVAAFARRAGFEIISCAYETTTKYPESPEEDNWICLVAKKQEAALAK